MATAAVTVSSTMAIQITHFDSLNGQCSFFRHMNGVDVKNESGCIQMRQKLSHVRQSTNKVETQVECHFVVGIELNGS